MNSRERFLKVLHGEVTDRVPVTLFMADQGHFITQIYPDIDPHDYLSIQLKIVELQKQLGVDVFVRMLYGVMDPLEIVYGGLNVSQETENWEVKTTEHNNGNTVIQSSTIKTPDGILTQDFSINEIREGTFMYSCTKKPIVTEEDLDIAIKYEPKISKAYKAEVKRRIKIIKDAVGNDGIVGTWSPYGPFNTASLIIDHTELYMLFMTDYEFYEKLMNFSIDRVMDYTAAIDEAGVDVHCIGGNVAGGFIGEKNFEKYILPFEKRYIDFVQKNGTPAMYHNCGEIMNLVNSYKKLGVKIVEPFSPAPLGDADLARAKELVKGDYIILGGVDQVNVLQNGTVELVKKVTKRTIDIGKPGGKFILQSADFLEYGTPMENIEAYVKTAMDNAWY